MTDKLNVEVKIDLTKARQDLERFRDEINSKSKSIKMTPEIDAAAMTASLNKKIKAEQAAYAKSEALARKSADKRMQEEIRANTKLEIENKKSADRIAVAKIKAEGKVTAAKAKAEATARKESKKTFEMNSAELAKYKQNVKRDIQQINSAFKLDTTKNKAQMKAWAADIRKVGLVARDTWKKVEQAMVEKYIKIWIDRNKLTQDLNMVKAKIRESTSAKVIDVEVREQRALADLESIRKKIDIIDDPVQLQVELINEKRVLKQLDELKRKKREVAEKATMKIDANTKSLNAGLTEANRQMKNIENTWVKATSRLWAHFSRLWNSIRARLWVAAALVAIGMAVRQLIQWLKEATQIALKRESAFTGVEKTTEGTNAEFKQLRKELVDLTREIPSTFEEIAKIAELWWQMGVPIGQIKEFTKAVAQIATTTNLSIEQAATQFARLHNILQLPLDSIDRTASAVVDLGNNFAAQEDEILNFTLRVAGSWKVIWMSAWELAGLSTALTSVWIKAEMWGSSMSKAMLKMNSAVIDSGDALNKFAKVSWLTADEFKAMRENDAAGAFTKFVEGIGNAWDSADWIITELLWNNVRTKQSFLNLAWAGDLLARAIEKGNEAYAQNIALTDEAILRYGTEESKIQLLNNQYAEQQERLWKGIIPAYKTLLKIKIKLVTAFNNISEKFKWFGTTLIIFTAALAAAVLALSWLWIPLMVLLTAAWALWTVFAIWWGGVDVMATKTDILKNKLWELNNEIEKNTDSQDELMQKYLSWKISIEQYTEQLDKLIAAERMLAKEKKLTLSQIEAQAIIERKISENNKTKQELANKETDAIKKLLDLKEKKNKIEKEYYDNVNILGEAEAYDIFSKKIGEVDTAYFEMEKEVKKASETFSKADKALNSHAEVLKLVSEWWYGVEEQTKILNGIELNMDWTASWLNKIREILRGVSADSRQTLLDLIKVQQAKIASLQDEYDDLSRIEKKFDKSLLWDIFNISITKEINNEVTALWDLADRLNAINAISLDDITPWKTPNITNTKEKLGEIENVLWQIVETSWDAEDKLKWIWELLAAGWLSEETKKRLMDEQLELSTKLVELKEAENAAMWAWLSSAEARNAIIQAEIVLEENRYITRLQHIEKTYDDERKKAEAIMKAKEKYETKVRELEWKTHETILENAEEVIAKRKEIKEAGQNAYNGIWGWIEETAKALADLADEMKRVNDEMDKIKTDATEELQERYVDIVSELEEVNIQIQEQQLAIAQAGEETSTLSEDWKIVTDQIKEWNWNIEDYLKSIDKINESMSKLEGDSKVSLADRYVELWDEIEKNQKRLDVLNWMAFISTAEAEEKLKLENDITSALAEQALAAWEVSAADISAAETKTTETPAEKIIRERDEKLNAYNLELTDLQTKLADEQALMVTAATEEASLRAQLDVQEEEAQRIKLEKLEKQLQDYYDTRASLIQEKSVAENELSTSEIRDALNNELTTKTQWILDARDMDLKAKQTELQDLKDANKLKLEELKDYYIQAANMYMQSKGMYWEWFTFEDFQSSNVRDNLSWVDMWSFDEDVSSEYRADLKEQKEALDKLSNVSSMLTEFLKKDKSDWSDILKMLKVVVGLRADANLGQTMDAQTLKTINQSNKITVNNWLDLESLERMLRQSVKI